MTVSSGCFNAGSRRRGQETATAFASRVGGVCLFIGNTKATLARVLGEKGVVLTA